MTELDGHLYLRIENPFENIIKPGDLVDVHLITLLYLPIVRLKKNGKFERVYSVF